MNARERHMKRTAIAVANGYVPTPLPPTPPWAAPRLTEQLEARAYRAAAELRGLPKNSGRRK